MLRVLQRTAKRVLLLHVPGRPAMHTQHTSGAGAAGRGRQAVTGHSGSVQTRGMPVYLIFQRATK